MKKINLILISIVFISTSFPVLSSANEIRLESQKAKVHIGEQFLVNVVVGSTDSLNAVEGKIVFDELKLKINDVMDGNSVINFWVEKPKVKENTIVFSGATPVGFSGNSQKLFSILFTAKEKGDASINIADSSSYLNDGSGSKTQLTLIPTHILIDSSINNKSESFADVESPEDFTPFLVKDESINNNKFSLIFATQDKGVGIKEFKISEGKFSIYHIAESPYIIRDQELHHDIYIKVTDKNNNSRVVIYPAKNKLQLWMQKDVITIIFGIIIFIGSILYLWKKFQKQ